MNKNFEEKSPFPSFEEVQSGVYENAEAERNYKQAKDGLKQALVSVVANVLNAVFSAWMVMFAVAILGFPLAYLTCLLITYAAMCVIASGVAGGVTGATQMIKNAIKDGK